MRTVLFALLVSLAAAATAVAAMADLSVNIGVSPASGLGPAGNLTYTAVVKNSGPDAAGGVSLVISLPPATDMIPLSATAPCQFSGDVAVTCSFNVLAAGGSTSVTVVGHPIRTVANLVNARVTATATDPNLANNESRTGGVFHEIGISDVKVELADAPDPLNVGNKLTYIATVTNGGDDDAYGVVLRAVMPPSINVLSAASSRGSCEVAHRTVTCTLGHLEYHGNPATVTIYALAKETGWTYTTVGVSVDSVDPIVANNSATARTWINPRR